MPMVRRSVLYVQVVVGTVLAVSGLLAGCGSGGSDSAPSTADERSGQASATSVAPKAGPVTVEVKDMKFSPADVTVKVGETVTWKFRDSAVHNVQGIGDKAMGINSPIFQTGEWSYTFTVPGTYRYLCSIHPQMRGTVTVE